MHESNHFMYFQKKVRRKVSDNLKQNYVSVLVLYLFSYNKPERQDLDSCLKHAQTHRLTHRKGLHQQKSMTIHDVDFIWSWTTALSLILVAHVARTHAHTPSQKLPCACPGSMCGCVWLNIYHALPIGGPEVDWSTVSLAEANDEKCSLVKSSPAWRLPASGGTPFPYNQESSGAGQCVVILMLNRECSQWRLDSIIRYKTLDKALQV